ncbi:TPA: hypothetical protein ACTADN_001895 [Salmonella enterica subsp. enterica serovar Birkenhead]
MVMPLECPQGFTVYDVYSLKSRDSLKGNYYEGYSCYIQTPDGLKGHEGDDAYFDFEAARKQQEPLQVPLMSGASDSSSSTSAISVMCVDFGNAIDLGSQSFASGLFMPLFFFFLGMGISAIYNVIKGI